MQTTTPVLVYDGDCGICREWVGYWLSLTGERVVYRPYQSAAADYPDIPIESFRSSMTLIEPGGGVYRGAGATFKLLSHVRGHGLGWWLYRFLPGFAIASEWTYGVVSRRRGLLRYMTHLLWGPHYSAPRYENVQWWFLRGLGLIYVFAFVSAGVQITALIGDSGLLPIADYLNRLGGYYGGLVWYHAPTVFWLNHSDWMLQAVCAAGALAGLAIVFSRLTTPALIAAFVLYLSLYHAGQDFFQFQWDLLLLEAGFLAIFVNAWPNLIRWLYRWLLVRFLFMAGILKLTSGDPTWHGLTALQYHFETQPLPTVLAWYAHQLPDAVLMAAAAFTLILEIVLVVLVFTPRRLRMLFAWLVLVFQIGILLTGNYNFFNLLTMLLVLWLFDDAALARVLGKPRALLAVAHRAGRADRVLCPLFALLIVLPGVELVSRAGLGHTLPGTAQIHAAVQPFKVVNAYGLFARMTTRRPEIQIEGSNDGLEWSAYVFRYKPGDPARAPGWIIPHQPRLDWQMWFAALGNPRQHPWFEPLLIRLLENDPAVTRLLAGNPFPDHGPRHIRAQLFLYRFTDPETRAATGHWWRRQPDGGYFPAMSLDEIRHRPDRVVPFR